MATRFLLAGHLDVTTIDDLAACLESTMPSEAAPGKFFVDAIAVSSMDEIGARAFIQFCNRLALRGPIEISWLQPGVREALAAVGTPLPAYPPWGRPQTLWVGSTAVD